MTDVNKLIWNLIWNSFKIEINTSSIRITSNEIGYYIRLNNFNGSNKNITRKKLESFMTKLPSDVDCFEDNGVYVFAVVDTDEKRVKFAEAKASLIGRRLLDKKKETVVLMKMYLESLKDLRDVKAELNML